MATVGTLKEVVAVFELRGIKIGLRALQKWRKREGFPVERGGKFDPDKILAWRSEWETELARKEDDAAAKADQRALRREQLRGQKIKNDKEEFKQQQLAGQFFKKSEVAERFSIFSHELKEALKKLQAKGAVVEMQIIEEHLRRAERRVNAIGGTGE